MKYSKKKSDAKNYKGLTEENYWDSGFSIFKRRIGELLQLGGYSDGLLDDEELLPFYRMGESETYVLSAFGCAVGA